MLLFELFNLERIEMQLPEVKLAGDTLDGELQFSSLTENLSHKFGEFARFQPSYQQQREEIRSLLNTVLVKGQKWCLIHMRWYRRWKQYVGYDSCDISRVGEEAAYPGPIDNTDLVENDKLRRYQVDDIDYQLVPELAWDKLLSWYDINEGSMKIRKQVVVYGKYVKQCKIEIYLLELKCYLHPNESDFRIVILSRCETLRTLENKIRKVYNIDYKKQTQVYNNYLTYTCELIRDLNQEAYVGLFDGQRVLLEVQNEDGTWPRPVVDTSVRSNYP